jgi:hypothetical protein
MLFCILRASPVKNRPILNHLRVML